MRISVGVAYGSDIDKVRNILLDIANKNDNISKKNTPRVRFRTFGESSINFQLLFWIPKPEMRGRVSDEINTEIYKTFNRENIEIPFPQRTIHLKNNQ